VAADGSAPSRDAALAVAFADRVTAVLSIFLGRLDSPFGTDTFDPGQGIQLRWRQLNGMTQPPDLQRLLEAQLPRTRDRIRSSGRPGASAAAAAVEVILVLLDDSVGDVLRCAAVAESAVRVATEMDRVAARPPGDQLSWAEFERRGQADLIGFVAGAPDGLSPAFIDELREMSGEQGMAYRNGMKALAVV
jgi:hypothetical protein